MTEGREDQRDRRGKGGEEGGETKPGMKEGMGREYSARACGGIRYGRGKRGKGTEGCEGKGKGGRDRKKVGNKGLQK